MGALQTGNAISNTSKLPQCLRLRQVFAPNKVQRRGDNNDVGVKCKKTTLIASREFLLFSCFLILCSVR